VVEYLRVFDHVGFFFGCGGLGTVEHLWLCASGPSRVAFKGMIVSSKDLVLK
jgi:hypothetical protein